MGDGSILSVILTVTIGTVLNFSGGNNGPGLKNVISKLSQKFPTHVDLLPPNVNYILTSTLQLLLLGEDSVVLDIASYMPYKLPPVQQE